MSTLAFAQQWAEASKKYADETGKDLTELPVLNGVEDLVQIVESKNQQFDEFRKRRARLYEVLKAVATPFESLCNLASGAATQIFPPSAMIFGAVSYLIGAARGVSDELDSVVDLLDYLRDLTVRLSVYNSMEPSQKLRGKLTEILLVVLEILARCTKKIQGGGFGRFKNFLRNVAAGSDKRMQGLVARLEKLTSSEARLVGAETLMVSRKTALYAERTAANMETLSRDLSGLSTKLDQLSAVPQPSPENLHSPSDSKRRQLQSLLQPSRTSEIRLRSTQRERLRDSGEWLLDDQKLREWLSATAASSRIMWLSGIPGSGKSFLALTIIEHLRSLIASLRSENRRYPTAAYHFFQETAGVRSFHQALRDVSFQIADSNSEYAEYVLSKGICETHINTISSAWSELFAEPFLTDVALTANSVSIVLDGVDEALPDERQEFFQVIADVRKVTTSRLHIAMLGRPHVIEECANVLGDLPTIHVRSAKHNEDIYRYVAERLAKGKLGRLFPSLKDGSVLRAQILDEITRKADGMFKWAELMLGQLDRLPSTKVSSIRKALESAPPGLIEMLQHVLGTFSQSLPAEEVQDLITMLMWVAVAKRVLCLAELDGFLRMNSPSGEGVIDLERRLRRDFASFFTLYRLDGLLTADLDAKQTQRLTSSETPSQTLHVYNSNFQSTYVSFAHASISDLFGDDEQREQSPRHSTFGMTIRDAEIRAVKCCLSLITNRDLRDHIHEARAQQVNTATLGILHLVSYAAGFLADHFEALKGFELDISDTVSLRGFFSTLLFDPQCWAASDGEIDDEILLLVFSQVFPLLYYSAVDICNLLLFNDDIETVPDHLGTRRGALADQPLLCFEPLVKQLALTWLAKPVNTITTYGVGSLYDVGPTSVFDFRTRLQVLSAGDVQGQYLWPPAMLSREQVRDHQLSSRCERRAKRDTTPAMVEEAADWASKEHDASWHCAVALSIRRLQGWQDKDSFARVHLHSALQIQPDFLPAEFILLKMETSILHQMRPQQVSRAETLLATAAADTLLPLKIIKAVVIGLHRKLGQHYDIIAKTQLSQGLERAETVFFLNKAVQHWQSALLGMRTDDFMGLGRSLRRVCCPIGTGPILYDARMNDISEWQGLDDLYGSVVRFLRERPWIHDWVLSTFSLRYHDPSEHPLLGVAMAATCTNQLEWFITHAEHCSQNLGAPKSFISTTWDQIRNASVRARYGGQIEGPLITLRGVVSELEAVISRRSLAKDDQDDFTGYMRRAQRIAASTVGDLALWSLSESRSGMLVDTIELLASKQETKPGARYEEDTMFAANGLVVSLAIGYRLKGNSSKAQSVLRCRIAGLVSHVSASSEWKTSRDHPVLQRDLAMALFLADSIEEAIAIWKAVGHGLKCVGSFAAIPCASSFSTQRDQELARVCRIDLTTYCPECYDLLLEGVLQPRICSVEHDFVEVDVAKHMSFGVRDDDMLFGAGRVPFEAWKGKLVDQWCSSPS